MSIADKLIYLNGTKEKLKESINNIGGSITDETTFRAYAEELDNIYTNLPKTTGEGSNLSLSTLKGRINVDDILGDTSQEGTPTPSSPQDINVVTGTQEVVVSNKNKLPSGESGTYTSSGASHTSNGKGVYTINGTATAMSYHNWAIEPYTIKSGDYLHLGNSTINGNVEIALLVSGSEQIMFRSCNAINVIQDLSSYTGKVVNYVRTFTNAQTLSNFELKPMICNLSTQTDFIAHQEQTKTLHLGDIELSKIGTYQDRIFETSGKNLANVDETQIGKAWNNASNNARAILVLPIKHNTQYTISYRSLGSLEGIYYGYRTEETTAGTGVTQMSTTSLTITTNDTNNYIVFQFNKTSISLADIQAINLMLNEGSTALPYEPYGSDKWYIEKNVGIRNLNNATSFTYDATNAIWYYSLSQRKANTDTTQTIFSDKLFWNGNFNGVVNAGSGMTNFQIATNNSGTSKDIFIKNTNYNGVDTFMNWLNTLNPVIYYQLATPTYTEITNETLKEELNELEKMMSYNGQTNISVSGNLPMLLDVTALKGE